MTQLLHTIIGNLTILLNQAQFLKQKNMRIIGINYTYANVRNDMIKSV